LPKFAFSTVTAALLFAITGFLFFLTTYNAQSYVYLVSAVEMPDQSWYIVCNNDND